MVKSARPPCPHPCHDLPRPSQVCRTPDCSVNHASQLVSTGAYQPKSPFLWTERKKTTVKLILYEQIVVAPPFFKLIFFYITIIPRWANVVVFFVFSSFFLNLDYRCIIYRILLSVFFFIRLTALRQIVNPYLIHIQFRFVSCHYSVICF